MKVEKTKAFGLETTFDSADLILIPIPWEVTSSYGSGTSKGPELIRKASFQLDFFNPSFNGSYNHRIHFEKPDVLIESLNKTARAWATEVQENWEENKVLNEKERALSEKVNQASQSLFDWVYEKSSGVFQRGKLPVLVGGEHSVSEGLICLVGEKYKGEYGLLHIDAHADLRESYQGFKHSHASVMYNVLNMDFPPKKLVQLGVRDFCEREFQLIKKDLRIECFFDEEIFSRLFAGETWAEVCQQIIGQLPSEIYISLDVDALSWNYAPGTGTPVPGGLSFRQLLYLFSEIKRQKKRLIAFDLVETSPGEKDNVFSEWNGNVSARLIYYLAGLALLSGNKIGPTGSVLISHVF